MNNSDREQINTIVKNLHELDRVTTTLEKTFMTHQQVYLSDMETLEQLKRLVPAKKHKKY